MKITKSYIASLLLLGAAFTACDEELDRPPVIVPEATIEANTSILEVKKNYWSEDRNYIDTIGVNENGEHVVIAGRIISSDETGNIYKNIVIQDKTAALTISINENDMFESYHIGQEVVIDLTNMYIGKYNGLQQLGYPEYSASYGWEATFMEMDHFKQHSQYNGLPRPTEIDTFKVDIKHLNSIKSNADSLQRWQSQLVRFDSVYWVEAGKPYSDPSASTNRYIKDANGNKMLVRNSSYATFHDKILPSDTGSVVGILSFYGSDWQVLLRSTDDCIGFDESVAPDAPNTPGQGAGDGSEATPYNVSAVIDGATGSEVWVEGYIVGWVEGASIDEGTHFSVPASSASNILISDNPNASSVAECVPVQLVAGSAARSALNLMDNPGNLGKKVSLKGNLTKYFGVSGVKETTEYKIDGNSGGSTPVAPEGTSTYKKASSITSGKEYILVANGKVATALTSGYGYLKVVDATTNNDVIEVANGCGFVFTSTTGGYTMTDYNGKYMYMKDDYNSFNVDTTLPSDGGVWTIAPQADGTMIITNVAKNKSIQYDTQYTSYGAYPDVRGVYPTLYEKIN